MKTKDNRDPEDNMDPKDNMNTKVSYWHKTTAVSVLGIALYFYGPKVVDLVESINQHGQDDNTFVAQPARPQIETESLRGVEFFNSSFDSAALSAPGAAKALKATITEPNRRFFLSLLALRKVSKDLYDEVDPRLKAGILVDALNQSVFFNGWGLPHRALEKPSTPLSDAAAALAESLAELGMPAKQWLGRLLLQRRSAPLWGSEPIAAKYRYRVADYALVSLLLNDNRRMTFPVRRADRDPLIKEYLNSLQINTTTMNHGARKQIKRK